MFSKMIAKCVLSTRKRILIRVKKPGTLSSHISSYLKFQITHLVVEGELNGTDLSFLREMAGSDSDGMETLGKLSVLDLSKATFVSGGSAYYHRCFTSRGKIGKYAFYRCYRLTKVTLPVGVTAIGECAFGYCTGLKSLTVPDTVRRIGDLAFFRCETIESIILGRKVITIGESVFRNCKELKRLVIADGKSSLQLSSDLLQNCPLESLYIGRNLDYSVSPFEKSRELKEVMFGRTVTRIGEKIFLKCHRLHDVYMRSIIPPLTLNSFDGRCRGITLHIPIGAQGNYAKHSPWNIFHTIVTI